MMKKRLTTVALSYASNFVLLNLRMLAQGEPRNHYE